MVAMEEVSQQAAASEGMAQGLQSPPGLRDRRLGRLGRGAAPESRVALDPRLSLGPRLEDMGVPLGAPLLAAHGVVLKVPEEKEKALQQQDLGVKAHLKLGLGAAPRVWEERGWSHPLVAHGTTTQRNHPFRLRRRPAKSRPRKIALHLHTPRQQHKL